MGVSYLISCRIPGCEWRTRDPGAYVPVETALVAHVQRDHTPLQVIEALVSVWQFDATGQRRQDDPLTFIKDAFEKEEKPSEPIREAKASRRKGGRKMRFAKTYSQMIRDAFQASGDGPVLTTRAIREYMGGVTKAIIPTASVCATLHKMCEDGVVEHVDTGRWKLNGKA